MAKKEKMSEQEKETNREKRGLKTRVKNECFALGLFAVQCRLEYLKNNPNPSLPKTKWLTKQDVIDAFVAGIEQYHEEKEFS